MQVIEVAVGVTVTKVPMHYCGAKKTATWPDSRLDGSHCHTDAPMVRWAPERMRAPLLRIAAAVKAKNVASLQRLWLIFSNILDAPQARFATLERLPESTVLL
ncbi:MAG: hypothetical protein RR983_14080 [Massilia sp.]